MTSPLEYLSSIRTSKPRYEEVAPEWMWWTGCEEESSWPSLSHVMETGKSTSSSTQLTWTRIPSGAFFLKVNGAILGGTEGEGGREGEVRQVYRWALYRSRRCWLSGCLQRRGSRPGRCSSRRGEAAHARCPGGC